MAYGDLISDGPEEMVRLVFFCVSSGKVHESARMRHILNLETCIREVDVSQWWLRPFGLRRLPPLMEAKLRCKQVLSGDH